jgi:hypothetical protein
MWRNTNTAPAVGKDGEAGADAGDGWRSQMSPGVRILTCLYRFRFRDFDGATTRISALVVRRPITTTGGIPGRADAHPLGADLQINAFHQTVLVALDLHNDRLPGLAQPRVELAKRPVLALVDCWWSAVEAVTTPRVNAVVPWRMKTMSPTVLSACERSRLRSCALSAHPELAISAPSRNSRRSWSVVDGAVVLLTRNYSRRARRRFIRSSWRVPRPQTHARPRGEAQVLAAP